MVASRISVRLLVSVALLDFAKKHFARLLEHPDHREDALQELRMIDAFLVQATDAARCRMARRALSWLSYDLGVEAAKPRLKAPLYQPLPKLERGTFLKDLSDRLEAARVYERAV